MELKLKQNDALLFHYLIILTVLMLIANIFRYYQIHLPIIGLALSTFVFLYLIFTNKYSMKHLFVVMLTVLIILINIIRYPSIESIGYGISFYFFIFIVLFLDQLQTKNIENNLRPLITVFFAIAILLWLVSLVGIGVTDTGQRIYFAGLYRYPQTISYIMLFLYIWLSRIIYNKYFLFLIVTPLNFVAIYLIGARSGYIGFLIYAIYLLIMYSAKNTNFQKIIYFLPRVLFWAVGLYVGYFLYDYNVLKEKWLIDFTEGRSILWYVNFDILLYDYDILSIIFGKGFLMPFDIIETAYGYNHWAHNDFISLLMSTGIMGLSIYLYLLTLLSKQLSKMNLEIIIFIIVFLAFTNGFYTYTIAVIFMCLIICDLKLAKAKDA